MPQDIYVGHSSVTPLLFLHQKLDRGDLSLAFGDLPLCQVTCAIWQNQEEGEGSTNPTLHQTEGSDE